MEQQEFKRYQCSICGFIYDEALGWQADGIPPGTKWEDIPKDWMCPECGVSKSEFMMEEIEW
ncbi:MAG: rubredoxin [Wenzhouxiangellaceae bacterium]